MTWSSSELFHVTFIVAPGFPTHQDGQWKYLTSCPTHTIRGWRVGGGKEPAHKRSFLFILRALRSALCRNRADPGLQRHGLIIAAWSLIILFHLLWIKVSQWQQAYGVVRTLLQRCGRGNYAYITCLPLPVREAIIIGLPYFLKNFSKRGLEMELSTILITEGWKDLMRWWIWFPNGHPPYPR